LACLAFSNRELQMAEALRPYCETIDVVRQHPLWSKIKSILCLVTSGPLTLSYFRSKKLHRRIFRRLREENLDAAIVFSSSMAQYLPPGNSVKKIIDFTDVDSDKWFQYADRVPFPVSLIYRLEGRRLRKYEIDLAPDYDCCTVVSDVEAQLFRSYPGEFCLRTVPNGVDLEYFQPDGASADSQTMIFVGVMDYHANVDGVLYFHDQVLPYIHERFPQVVFQIVGGRPTRAIRRLARSRNVTVTGYVEDVRPFLKRATVCVVPLRIARGVQNKILEAMAIGLPVVATRRAMEGINARPGEDVMVADNPSEFARSTIQLLEDDQLRRRLSDNARRLVERTYRWDSCLQHLDHLLEELQQKQNRPSAAREIKSIP
jgi:sugar transferase (PEP-CTERM/EpsH1 system associated)